MKKLYCTLSVLLSLSITACDDRTPEQKYFEQQLKISTKANEWSTNDKLPVFDGRKYGLIKRDNRFFLIPKKYYHPQRGFDLPFKLLGIDISRKEKYQLANSTEVPDELEVFLTGQTDMGRYHQPDFYNIPRPDWTASNACDKKTNIRWNGLIVSFGSIDVIADNDWPKACVQVIEILKQIKEVTP